MGKGKNNNPVQRIWTIFASVKLAILIFALIALSSIIGTVLNQNAPPADTVKQLIHLFGESAPDVYKILEYLGFTDTYHSWWYMGLLVLLAVNIIACSLDRLPNILKIIREPLQQRSREQLARMAISKSILLNGVPDERIKEAVRRACRKAGFRCAEIEEDRGCQFYGQQGRFSRLGVYITHLSILIILVGAMIKLNFSENSFLYLPEGYTSYVTVAFPGMTREGESTLIPLGFGIHGDNFEVEFYQESTVPRSFRNQVTIIDNDQEVLQKTISANDPLIYKGTKFHLADFGTVPGRLGQGTFIFRVTTKAGRSEEVRLLPGQTFTIPGTSIIGTVKNFSPDLHHDEEGNLYTHDDRLYNPAVEIEFSESGNTLYTGWLYKRYPDKGLLPDGSRVEFLDYWGVEYSYLLVRKDPSVWWVYSGFIAMLLGLSVTFLMSHRRIWVHLVEEGVDTRIVIGATANKNRIVFEKKIDRFVDNLKPALVLEDEPGKC